ncbi:MAG: hypothetical protein ABJA98_10695 [Acidobacteriota bacterium]
MTRRMAAIGCWLTLVAISSSAWAQQAAAPARPAAPAVMRPPLFFSEGWKRLPAPVDDHGAWPASPDGVSNPNLELRFYGPSAKDLQLVAGNGQGDVTPLNLWTGMTKSPSAAALRDRNNFVDLSVPFAKIRWVVRSSGFHQARPILKLADGTWLVGDHASGTDADFNESEMSISEIRWLKLDMDRVVAVGAWIEHPNLGKVDEVGFADLMPGSGHGAGGYLNVGRIEVYGKPVKR